MWVVKYKCPDGCAGEFTFMTRPEMVEKVIELLRDFFALRLSVELK